MTLEAIRYRPGSLQILNQLLLPHQSVHEEIRSVQDAYEAIRSMKVRGAPAIAIVGCLSVAVELRAGIRGDSLVPFLRKSLAVLTSARPTAANMARAAGELLEFTERESTQRTAEELTESVIGWIEAMLQRDIDDNQKMGNYGAQHILSGVPQDSVTILTHGNTGSLATAGYGTAQLAIAARHHRIPFYVVAPSTSCDLSLESGRHVVIEERPPVEMTSIGGLPFAAPGIEVWNPAFDVTPHQLITGGIITELGVFLPSELQAALTGRLTAL